MLFDLFKAFDKIETNNKSDIFSPNKKLFSFMRAQHVVRNHLLHRYLKVGMEFLSSL